MEFVVDFLLYCVRVFTNNRVEEYKVRQIVFYTVLLQYICKYTYPIYRQLYSRHALLLQYSVCICLIISFESVWLSHNDTFSTNAFCTNHDINCKLVLKFNNNNYLKCSFRKLKYGFKSTAHLPWSTYYNKFTRSCSNIQIR